MDEDQPTVELTQSLSTVPKGTLLVAFGAGTFASKELPEKGSLTIGRGANADLRIEDESVSRLHARVRSGQPPTVEDLESRNGVKLRGVPIAAKVPTPFTIGDVLMLGSIVVVLQLQRAAPSSPRALEDFEARVDQLIRGGEHVEIAVVQQRGNVPIDFVEDTVSNALLPDDLMTTVQPGEIVLAGIGRSSGAVIANRARAALFGIGAQCAIGIATSDEAPNGSALIRAARAREEIGPIFLRAPVLANTAIALFAENRFEQAREVADASIALQSEQEPELAMMCLMLLAKAAHDAGDTGAASSYAARAKVIDERLGGANASIIAKHAAASSPRALRGIKVSSTARTLTIDTTLVELGTRRAAWVIAEALCKARIERSGDAVSRDQLVAIGWPNEKIHPDAAQNRLYVAIATLRRLGLRDVILSRDDGYVIDPDVEVSLD